jgi:serine protease
VNDPGIGTSFSAPLVSATVALMRTANRDLTPAQVRQALQATARPFPTSGAPNDVETQAVIQQCHAPTTTDQSECYCTTTTCGAGMLDARAAVTQVARLEAYIDGPLASVALNQAVTLGSSSTVLAPGHGIASRQWTLVTPGAGVADLGTQDATAASISLTPSANGVFVVQLTVTDNAGASSSTTMSVTAGTGNPTPPPSDSGGGGGGALSAAWLAALALAVWLSRPRRRT